MTIVVGYTPNQYGQAALVKGIAEARVRQMKLVVVNATKGDAWVDRQFASEGEVEGLDSTLAEADVEHEIRQSVGADIADQVLDVVDQVDASLLVIGIRHRTAVGKMLMGSTAQRLLMDCPCDVLAVKPKRPA